MGSVLPCAPRPWSPAEHIALSAELNQVPTNAPHGGISGAGPWPREVRAVAAALAAGKGKAAVHPQGARAII